jgi:hypothetical protein
MDRAATLLARDELRPDQDVEVLDHRRQRDRERRGDLRHGKAVFSRQALEDRPPRRIGKRSEGHVEHLLTIFNH